MPKLKKALSLWEVTLIGVGIILGAGIYVLIGKAAGLAGNGLWLSFILAALVSSFTGLSYAELSSRFPKAGAEYVYIEKSFGRTLAWLVGWLIIVGCIIGAATVAIGFANYFSAIFHTPVMLTAFTLLVICGLILIAGIKESAFFTILFTLIETSGLIIIIFIGLPYIGSIDYLQFANGIKGVIEAGVLIFFAYIGFESITRLAEETKNAEKNIPRAVILSIAITTIIYILVGISAISVVPWQELAQAEAPLALVAQRVFGMKSFLILSVIALFSTFNTVLAILLSASRLVYGIAEFKALPRIFLSVSRKTHTPWASIVAVVLSSMAFLLLGDIKTVANLTNFTIFITFILVNAAVIYLRFKKPAHEGFKTPLNIGRFPLIPFFGILSCGFMIVNITMDVLVLGVILVVLGFVLDGILRIRVKEKLLHK